MHGYCCHNRPDKKANGMFFPVSQISLKCSNRHFTQLKNRKGFVQFASQSCNLFNFLIIMLIMIAITSKLCITQFQGD